jgi:putative membrane protein
MKKVFLMGSTLALLLTACKKDDTEDNLNANAQDQSFVTSANMSNSAEIRLGQLALSRSSNAGVKTFAQLMVTEHSQAQTDLGSVATGINVNVKDSIDAQHQMLMSRLDTLNGLAFDTVYINSQVRDHQANITLFQSEVSAGSNQSVKDYASKYLPHIQMHLNMADSIRTTF